MDILPLEKVSISWVIVAVNSSAFRIHKSVHLPLCTNQSFSNWRTHAFLKASLRKILCNHNTDWDDIAHIAAVAYNVFWHSSSEEAPFYLMFGWDAYMPTLFKLLLPKSDIWVMKNVEYTWMPWGKLNDGIAQSENS